MNAVTERTEQYAIEAATYLEAQVRSVLAHAVEARRRGLKVYESLQNLNEVIGTEYGDRVLYELIQNAHDAHMAGDEGQIAVRLLVTSETEGTLYVANGGSGFRQEDLEAIRNLSISSKDVGEGIGNKGLGFRSIETLTNDVRIYSRRSKGQTDGFDGYCFRFAQVGEVEDLLCSSGIEKSLSREVAETIPRYLIPIPLKEQPEEVVVYARRGYATVVVAPLRTAEAVALATAQVKALSNIDVPLLLFLDRIAKISIEVDLPHEKPHGRLLQRRQSLLKCGTHLTGTRMYEVDVGESRRYLVISHDLDKHRVMAAVERSIPQAPQLKRWLSWKGQPVVSVAVGLSASAIPNGRLYNFLPMGDEAISPLIGYLDAPFFSEIDRRNADLNLPLNATFVEAAAEACASAALSIVEHGMSVPPHAVFDLFAWTGNQAAKLDKALTDAGTSLRDARVIPSFPSNGAAEWSSLSEVCIWPHGTFTVLKDRDVAKHVGAQLVSGALDARRIERLHDIAKRTFRSLSPSGEILAAWAEAFARSLFHRKVATRTWARFYEDLTQVFDSAGAPLEVLHGAAILYDRTGRLRAAGEQGGVFVRTDPPKGAHRRTPVPLPPGTLTRRYRFLHERIRLRRETLDTFIKAGLVRKYDAVEALAGLSSALGKNPNDNRRREALVWAFKVWRTATAGVEEELRNARIYVQTLTGWQPGSLAAFSASWTTIGRTLENFLVEAAEVSTDCRRARGSLLITFEEWPISAGDTKKQWIRFLELIGVADGLRPVSGQIPSSGAPAYTWRNLLRTGRAAEGLDSHWCAEVAEISFDYPYTNYSRKGEAWRLSGQLEHDDLPETAREAFCKLAIEHLKTHEAEFFRFQIGRFDRNPRNWDARDIPTPLAVFFRSRSWVAASTREVPTFRKPGECWAARVKRGGPPRFMERLPEYFADLFESEELAALAFGVNLGFRDWQSADTAVDRLVELATSVKGIASDDRPAFRREYLRAWQEVIETSKSLPDELTLAINQSGQLQELMGDNEAPPNVILTQDVHRFEARALSSAGYAVLEVGDVSIAKVAELLATLGTFVPRLLDGVGVQLLVDGEAFVPRATDTLLTSLEMDWLAEVAVLGHELRGEQLERGISATTVDRRVRSIRVRRCETISLNVDNDDVASAEHLPWYAFEHETLPTLILTNSVSLDWPTLAGSLSSDLSRLIDSRLRSLKLVLLQLGIHRTSEQLDSPSNEALARALECDVQTVQDHRAALRNDLGHILHLLIPVVGYFKGADLARKLRYDADNGGTRFDITEWLQQYMTESGVPVQGFIEACKYADDRAALRRELDLDYARFNRILIELGEPPLSNEAELRQLYDAYLAPMRQAIIDRLRRHHLSDFREGRDLSTYLDRKTLAPLSFDPAWVLTRETLTLNLVETHVSKLLDELLGADRAVALPPFTGLVEGNRKTVREFATQAIPVIRAWCRRNGVSVPEPWNLGDAQVVTRYLENTGLLDFEPVAGGRVAAICRRANSWPEGMPLTLDSSELGLDVNEVAEEEKRREQERQRHDIVRRSIDFAGHSLDTGDPSFPETLQQIAKGLIATDEGWYERSRQRTSLVAFAPSDRASSGQIRGTHGGSRRRERQLTDTQRQAMGLASEWLAFQYLRRRHGQAVDETCWVSENRARFFGGSEGDDSAGYDFLVTTTQAKWCYEVKSSLDDSGEFELTANELRVASSASKDGRVRYRILYVPFVFSPDKWRVLTLPNPMGETTRNRFMVVGRGAVRFRFERH